MHQKQNVYHVMRNTVFQFVSIVWKLLYITNHKDIDKYKALLNLDIVMLRLSFTFPNQIFSFRGLYNNILKSTFILTITFVFSYRDVERTVIYQISVLFLSRSVGVVTPMHYKMFTCPLTKF